MGVWNKVSRALLNPCPKPSNRQFTLDTSRFIDVIYDKMLSKICNRMIRSLDRKIVWRRGNTLYECLRNVKDWIPDNRKADIYEIPIFNKDEGCLEYYLGSTARSKWLNEHKADIIAGRLTMALVARFYEQNIDIDWGNARVIKNIYDGRNLITHEAIEMIKHSMSRNLINDNTPDDLLPLWVWAAKNRV